jgi:hypothetical protein
VRAERDLSDDLDALVRLYVRTVRQTDAIAVVLRAGEVRLEPVEVDDRSRRCDVERHPGRRAIAKTRSPLSTTGE